MGLTTLRVRGKRGRPAEQKSAKANGKPKRLRTAREIIQDARIKRWRATSLNMLPLEVIEQIFILSENVNFPRCHPLLGSMLSSRGTLLRLLVAAFGPTWENWFGCALNEVHSYALFDTDDDRFGGNPEFQSDLLACSWAKLPLILEAQQLWIRHKGKGRLYRHVVALGGELNQIGHDLNHDHSKDEYLPSIQACFDADFTTFCQTAVDDSMQLELREAGLFSRHSNMYVYLDVHPRTRIPDKLLCGPFDEEMIQRLLWLVKGGARQSIMQTWEITYEGFENMFLLKEKRLFMCLLRIFQILGIFAVQWVTHVFDLAFNIIDKRLDELELSGSEAADLGWLDADTLGEIERALICSEEDADNLDPGPWGLKMRWYGDADVKPFF